MSEYLPYSWLMFNEYVDMDDILATTDDAKTGYIVEVDLHFPIELT